MGYAMDAIEGNGIVCLSAFIGRLVHLERSTCERTVMHNGASPTEPTPQQNAHDSENGVANAACPNCQSSSSFGVSCRFNCARARVSNNFEYSSAVWNSIQTAFRYGRNPPLSGRTQHSPACSLFSVHDEHRHPIPLKLRMNGNIQQHCGLADDANA